MLKAIIIDDEPACCKTLATLLERYCNEVNVIVTCHNGEEGLTAIHRLSPDIVFLDIEMPKMNGFDMLEQLPKVNFHLIFTTSYDQYALKAFRFSAIDYLLKPVDREELQKAVHKVSRPIRIPLQQQLEILMQTINNPLKPINKIALPTMQGLQLIAVDSIISCESDDNYTILKLKNKIKWVVSCTLKEIEEMLTHHPFVRIHRSYLVNVNEVEKYVRGEGGYLIMSDGSTIDVSRSKKEVLLKMLLPNR
jgi:two-component system, LytTR family, response regulator